jgi:excinuclease ABC subunit C
LAKRINSYICDLDQTYKTAMLIRSVIKIETIVTRNEAEAFLLEANLIRKHKPKYNILLKDDKSFPCLAIKKDHSYPQIVKFRGKNAKNTILYGPFPSASKVNETTVVIQKAFLLRSCTDNFFESRKRPCLLYQIKRCSAPCVGKITIDDYQEYVNQAQAFLSGKANSVRENIAAKMQLASDNLDYETASILRDRLKAINLIQTKQYIDMPNLKDMDVIAVHKNDVIYSIAITFIRGGQNFGCKTYLPIVNADTSAQELLDSFIGSFYQRNIPPKVILLNEPLTDVKLIETALKSLYGIRVSILVPKLGDKRKLVEFTLNNAVEAAKASNIKHQKYTEIIAELKQLFAISKDIARIEAYDNSHIFGRGAVGAKIVWERGEFNKKLYRKYNLDNKNLYGGDDYSMLKQVLLRRLKTKEHLDSFFIIDGGKGHYGIVQEVLKELNIQIDFICVSKGKDRNSGNEIIINKDGNEINLKKEDRVKKFIQVIRDEAHRFAISSHTIKRRKEVFKSSLDVIPGLGAKRKKALLLHFGSVENISNAEIKELIEVRNINEKMAKIIHTALRL